MSIYIEFGKRLASLRQEKKMSQADISKKLGIAQTTYSGYENGARKIPLELIQSLSVIFDVSPTFLVSGQQPAPNINDMSLNGLNVARAFEQADPRIQNAVCALLEIPIPNKELERKNA